MWYVIKTRQGKEQELRNVLIQRKEVKNVIVVGRNLLQIKSGRSELFKIPLDENMKTEIRVRNTTLVINGLTVYLKDDENTKISSAGEKITVGGISVRIITNTDLNGYVFVKAKLTDDLLSFVWDNPLCYGFLLKGQKPATIEEEDLMKMIEGVKRLISGERNKLTEGDYVRITDGPFKGYGGVIKEVKGNRATVLVDFMDSRIPAPVRTSHLKKP